MKFLTVSEKKKKSGKRLKQKKKILPGVKRVSRTKGRMQAQIEGEGKVIKEEQDAYTFDQEPARVGIQWFFSMELGSGLWEGIRIYLEKPCKVEEMQMVKEELIREVRAECEFQKQALILKTGQEYFGSQRAIDE